MPRIYRYNADRLVQTSSTILYSRVKFFLVGRSETYFSLISVPLTRNKQLPPVDELNITDGYASMTLMRLTPAVHVRTPVRYGNRVLQPCSYCMRYFIDHLAEIIMNNSSALPLDISKSIAQLGALLHLHTFT